MAFVFQPLATRRFTNITFFIKDQKTLKTFFGLKEKFNENYMTDKTEQTTQDVIDCLQALINGNTEFLDKKIGS